MFRLCVDICERKGSYGPYCVYDPCCGGGTLLTAIGLLNSERIERIVGSDIDPKVLETARNNLALLTVEGINERLRQIKADYETYAKPSHKDALESARRIRDLLVSNRKPALATALLHLDATQLRAQDFHFVGQPDIVLADVPYGIKSEWTVQSNAPSGPVSLLLQSLLLLRGKPVVAIAADKRTRVEHENYRRLKRLSVGKRHIVVLAPM
jgi:23S rRNA G2445 N2-methylase RlmL